MVPLVWWTHFIEQDTKAPNSSRDRVFSEQKRRWLVVPELVNADFKGVKGDWKAAIFIKCSVFNCKNTLLNEKSKT